MKNNAIGLYLHIPFCRSKCPYCDFYSLAFDEDLADRYTAALIRTMSAHPFGELTADSLYLGGGTPSLLGANRLTALLDAAARSFSLDAESEVTIEANPESCDFALLDDLCRAGFNRLSIGAQSGNLNELAALGRAHTADQAFEAIQAGAKAGFANISADLMLAIPGQDSQSLSASIRGLADLPTQHISAYLLKLEPGTPMASAHTQGALTLPSEDAAADLYLQAVSELCGAGFIQYEISNFARPGHESRHNLKYWRCQPYLGLGPAAHSCLNGRFSFPADLDAFLEAETPFSLIARDPPTSAPEEALLLALRLSEGFDTARLNEWGIDPAPLLKKARALTAHGLCQVKGDRISLTPQGFLLSNTVTILLLDTIKKEQ